MLMRTDPFRELDRLTSQMFGGFRGTWTQPATMPMDAYRSGDEFVVCFDLPGVTPDSIDLQVERDTLTVRAERRPLVAKDDMQSVISERPLGVFSRQLFLGESLDTERIHATYEAGVLTLRIPVAEKSKPRKIEVLNSTEERREIKTP